MANRNSLVGDVQKDHLEDCNGIVSLASCFGEEEKDELGQRFKEFCGLNGSTREGRRVRR